LIKINDLRLGWNADLERNPYGVAFALNLHSVRDIPAQRSIESCKAPSVRSLVNAGPDVRDEKGHVAVTTNPVVCGYDSCTGWIEFRHQFDNLLAGGR
jgi:hypothetical protein